jgi:hypothetical protein
MQATLLIPTTLYPRPQTVVKSRSENVPQQQQQQRTTAPSPTPSHASSTSHREAWGARPHEVTTPSHKISVGSAASSAALGADDINFAFVDDSSDNISLGSSYSGFSSASNVSVSSSSAAAAAAAAAATRSTPKDSKHKAWGFQAPSTRKLPVAPQPVLQVQPSNENEGDHNSSFHDSLPSPTTARRRASIPSTHLDDDESTAWLPVDKQPVAPAHSPKRVQVETSRSASPSSQPTDVSPLSEPVLPTPQHHNQVVPVGKPASGAVTTTPQQRKVIQVGPRGLAGRRSPVFAWDTSSTNC